jgi:hypothetical protein
MFKTKYIKTKNKEIIMFGEIIQHSSFRNREPISAGFVSFGKDKSGNPTCTCYGESISLGLKSDEEDTKLARIQFGFLDINY